MRILHPTVTFLLCWPPCGSRRENRNALLSHWPLHLIGNASIKARPSYSKPRLCYIFFQRVSLATVFRRKTETKYSDEMPTNPSSRSCTQGLLYSGILRQLVCINSRLSVYGEFSVRKKIHLGESYVPIFAPTFARGWPLRSVSTAVTFTSAFRYFFLTPSVQWTDPSLVLILIADLHCLKFFFAHSLPRRFIVSFNSALFLFFFFCSDKSEVGSALFPPF